MIMTITMTFLCFAIKDSSHTQPTLWPTKARWLIQGLYRARIYNVRPFPNQEVTFLPFLSFSAMFYFLTGSFDKNHNCHFFVKATGRCFVARETEKKGMVFGEVFHAGKWQLIQIFQEDMHSPGVLNLVSAEWETAKHLRAAPRVWSNPQVPTDFGGFCISLISTVTLHSSQIKCAQVR